MEHYMELLWTQHHEELHTLNKRLNKLDRDHSIQCWGKWAFSTLWTSGVVSYDRATTVFPLSAKRKEWVTEFHAQTSARQCLERATKCCQKTSTTHDIDHNTSIKPSWETIPTRKSKVYLQENKKFMIRIRNYPSNPSLNFCWTRLCTSTFNIDKYDRSTDLEAHKY